MRLSPLSRTSVRQLLEELCAQRILILDGAMGTMIQQLHLAEADFRGSTLADHPRPLMGCNDLLSLTRPESIEEIHRGFLQAGADIISTNTFNANRISLADYGLADRVRPINLAAVACARRAIGSLDASGDNRPRFVAGSIGPTNRTASLSPDVNDPGYRAVNFDDLVATYHEQVSALVEGGVDILLPETTFDTLNLKACLFAIGKCFQERDVRLPVMASVTITDRSGRTLSGQTLEAFVISVSHADLFSLGINCALGPALMRPYVEELSQLTPLRTSCYPNAGLPNEFGGYDETPDQMARVLGEIGRQWLAEPCRRMLRHDAGPHPRHRPGDDRPCAANAAGRRTLQPVQRPGTAGPAAGEQLHDDRRADQRFRLAEVRPAGPRGPLRGGRGHRPAAGRGRGQRDRRQHGRGRFWTARRR